MPSVRRQRPRERTKDLVVFVDGGMRTVPISEIKLPVTLAPADSIVARLH